MRDIRTGSCGKYRNIEYRTTPNNLVLPLAVKSAKMHFPVFAAVSLFAYSHTSNILAVSRQLINGSSRRNAQDPPLRTTQQIIKMAARYWMDMGLLSPTHRRSEHPTGKRVHGGGLTMHKEGRAYHCRFGYTERQYRGREVL